MTRHPTRYLRLRTSDSGAVRVPASMWATFVLLPTVPASARRVDRREWLRWLDPTDRRYEPEPHGLFVPTFPRPNLRGAACVKPHRLEGATPDVEEYLLVGFDGSVELGFCPAMARDEMLRYFFGSRLVRRLWQTVNFTTDVRSKLGILAPHLLAVNLRDTEGTVLADFSRRWQGQDPSVDEWIARDAPRCLEPNIQIRREFTGEDFDEVTNATAATPPPRVREMADDICSAFGKENQVLLDG